MLVLLIQTEEMKQLGLSFDKKQSVEIPGFKEVSKDEYFAAFMHLDAVGTVVGTFPFKYETRLRHSPTIIAISVDSYGDMNDPDAEYLETRYYIRKQNV